MSHSGAWVSVEVQSGYCKGPGPDQANLSRDVMETSSPALSVAIAVLAVLLGLTGFGVYTAFGPPSKQLDDPFDDHDD